MSDKAPRSKQGKRRRDAAKAAAPAPASTRAPEPRREQAAATALRPGWSVPHPEVMPRPTFWPAALAFAVTFLLWGIVTSPIITIVGAILLVVSLSGWIGDIRNERAH
jgi:hypothetical protein